MKSNNLILVVLSVFFLISTCQSANEQPIADFLDAKVYQIAAQALGSQWFYSSKMYCADISTSNINLLYEYDKNIKKFTRHFKDSILYFSDGDTKAGTHAISLAKKSTEQIKHNELSDLFKHFLGLMEALKAKADSRTAKDPAAAKAILNKTKGTLDTPEWHHFYALLEHHSRNTEGFKEHIETAKKLTYKRKAIVDKWLKNGLQLDIDITKNMISLCNSAKEIAEEIEVSRHK